MGDFLYFQLAQNFKEASTVNEVLSLDDRYKRLRDRCNDHTHYNFYHYAMLNDRAIHMGSRGKWLDRFSEDACDIFILHLGYLFFLNDHYMCASDYLDALECGMEPEEGSQYRVAPYVQEMFDEVITPRRPDVTAAIRATTAMQLA